MTNEKLVEVKHLSLYFNKGKANEVKAIDDVSFDIYKGEVFGLVGESGSGKTTIGRTLLKLYEPDSGQILFHGKDVTQLKGAELKAFRKSAQMIFQDPQASLDERMKIKDIIAEGIDIHGLASSTQDRDQKVNHLLSLVGLNSDHATRYPHEFSGGQRQRIGIARALAINPEFIVADEPISALDVSIQAQVVNLLKDLQKRQGLTYLFIAHDLSMVKYISDRIGVLHWGKLLEMGTTDEVYNHPLHPYTRSLLSALPVPDPEIERHRKIMTYDPSIELDGAKREMRKVNEDHYIYSTKDEFDKYLSHE